MTISSASRRAGTYAGNGTTVTFPFGFKVFSQTDLLVIQTDASGVNSNLTHGTDYVVALNANQDITPGGTITMTLAPPTGVGITITSDIAQTQDVILATGGAFYPKTITDALDKSTIISQQITQKQSRSLSAPITDANPIGPLPTVSARAGRMLAFNSTGDPVPSENVNIVDISVANDYSDNHSFAAYNGKGLSITNDANLESWADANPRSGLYNIGLTVAQGALPAAFYYIEFLRYSSDSPATVYHTMRATDLSTGNGHVYENTAVNGTWVGWRPYNTLKANIASPVLSNPKSTADATAPLGLVTKQQSDLLRCGPGIAYSTSATLTAAHKGRFIYTYGTANVVLTLPLASTFGSGEVILVSCAQQSGAGFTTLNRTAVDVIYAKGANPVVTLNLSQGESVLLVSDGVNQWIKALGGGSGIGVGQTWQNMSASRVDGVTYTNSTGRPIAISVTTTVSANGTVTVNGVIMARVDSDATNRGYVFAIVPDNATYSVNNYYAGHWVELR